MYNLERAIVEMSEALPVEDRLVIFDAVRLPEPRQLDHHCVRYEGANVSPIPGPLNCLLGEVFPALACQAFTLPRKKSKFCITFSVGKRTG